MAGPKADFPANACVWFTLTAFMTGFFVLYAKTSTDYVSIAVPIVVGVLCVLTIFFLLMTSYTDPGIVPRKSIYLATEGRVPG